MCICTIIEVLNHPKWEIIWKRKRIVDRKFISEAFNQKQFNLVRNKITIIDPNVAARSLVEASDAVISIPYTSTALIAKELGVSTIFYDASGEIRQKRNHDIFVLKNKNELFQWKLSLNKLN